MAINPDRTAHLASLDRSLAAFQDDGLSWLEDKGFSEADARVAELTPLYVDVRAGPAYEERNDVLNPQRRGIWIRHPPTGKP